MRFEFGDCRLDADRRELSRAGEAVHVEPQVFDLLLHLIRNRDRVVTKDDLIAAVWDGRIVSESTLSNRINAARAAIGDSGERQQFIRTVARRGFMFVGEVREAAAPLPGAPMESGAVGEAKPALPLPDKPSIAVLPFANLSEDPQQEYFADGMAEEIITALSRCGWLFVIARNSSFTYKGKNVDVRQVGRDLGVRYVLEGSVRRAGNRVRTACQLVEAETGHQLLAERFDRSADDIFALQDDIAISLIGAIEPAMREIEAARVRRKRPDSLTAYDLVLRAMQYVTTIPMPDEALQAMPLLESALALEPDYARAHGFLALCHEILFLRAGFKEENRLAAIRHAQPAIAHGRDDATALALGAFVTALIVHDRVGASQAFERALELAPHSALALGLGGTVAGWTGEPERAIEWGARALRLNPFGPMTYLSHHSMALAHFRRSRYEDAAQAGHRAVQANPRFSVSYLALIPPLVKLGQIEAAKSAAARVLQMQSFSTGRFCEAFGLPDDVAADVGAAWRAAGLPA